MKLRFLHRAFKARYLKQRREVRSVLAQLRPGDTAVDVGANKGAYTYWLRHGVGASGKVFAYEPQPRLANYLREICAVMRWQNVTIEDCAVSDSAGTAFLQVPGAGDSPGATLEPLAAGTTPHHSYECRVETLDRTLAGAARIALLKVDAEGHELRVFRGAQEILRRHAPALFFECEARHLTTHTMADVFACLHALGYTGTFFTPHGERPLAEFDPAIHQRREGKRFWDAPGYCNNFLFRPNPPRTH